MKQSPATSERRKTKSSKRAAHDATTKILSGILKNTGIVSKDTKTPRQLERHLKGVANHRRISILILVAKRPNLTLDQISETLDCNSKTISDHTRRLVQAGLLQKRYQGNSVEHSLTPYGRRMYELLKVF